MLFRRSFSGLTSVVATVVQEEPVKKPVDEENDDSFKLKKLATPLAINSKILAAHAAAEQNQNQKVKNQKTDDDSGWTGLIDPKLLGENDTRAAKYATRFKRFASIRSDDFHHKALESGEYSVDDFYMTPRDFLDSITRAEPGQNHHSSIETLTQYLNNFDEKQLIKELQVTRKLKLEKRMDLQKNKNKQIDTKDLIDINFLSHRPNVRLSVSPRGVAWRGAWRGVAWRRVAWRSVASRGVQDLAETSRKRCTSFGAHSIVCPNAFPYIGFAVVPAAAHFDITRRRGGHPPRELPPKAA